LDLRSSKSIRYILNALIPDFLSSVPQTAYPLGRLSSVRVDFLTPWYSFIGVPPCPVLPTLVHHHHARDSHTNGTHHIAMISFFMCFLWQPKKIKCFYGTVT
jgi:hypothetical protein